jgi:hypothetical protein
MIEVGTPIWSNGFGCVTQVSGIYAGVALLAGGEPKVTGFVPLETAEFWAKNFVTVCKDDGRITDGFVVH